MLSGAREQSAVPPSMHAHSLLDPEAFRFYFLQFALQEHALLGKAPALQWDWFSRNIPWLEVPDKQLENIYYFRWYAFQKHIRQTPYGLIVDEFLDDVSWAGKYNSISAAAGHHLREARWLRDPAYADQYARFWFSPAGDPRHYSFPAADAVYSIYLARGDSEFAIRLLPQLVHNYEQWERTNRDLNGLFWQIDDRDGMEDSIGGSGYRPTINSYLYGDAIAISKIAAMAGNESLSETYSAKAAQLRSAVESTLWNPQAQFYETVPRDQGGGSVGVRELIGYVPWYFNLPQPDRIVAWKQLNDPRGFGGTYGPRTAELRSPRYGFANPHECLWNGPSWPFATTQTLVALANVLNGPPQSIVSESRYFELLSKYARSQSLRLPDGSTIPWIDEDLDPDTGDWIARRILESKGQPPKNRGRYYNHSGFADLLVTGLLGVRPSSGNRLTIHPLVPANWKYFSLDGLPYHGHLLTLFYDKSGARYHRGPGMHVLWDGSEIASQQTLGTLQVGLP
jgi:hypothetical protein